jgi:hypothetical protein
VVPEAFFFMRNFCWEKEYTLLRLENLPLKGGKSS